MAVESFPPERDITLFIFVVSWVRVSLDFGPTLGCLLGDEKRAAAFEGCLPRFSFSKSPVITCANRAEQQIKAARHSDRRGPVGFLHLGLCCGLVGSQLVRRFT